MNKNKEQKKNIQTKKLNQIPSDLATKLKTSSLDEHIGTLGFTCKGHLCEYEGYEEFYERLWLWIKVEKDKIYTLVTVDGGNTNCDVVYMDLYIKELIDENNILENKNIITKRLYEIPFELEENIKNLFTDEQLEEFDFKRAGRLCEYEGYENFPKYLWLWTKVKNDKIYTIATVEQGCYGLVYTNLYIKKVIEEINNKCC